MIKQWNNGKKNNKAIALFIAKKDKTTNFSELKNWIEIQFKAACEAIDTLLAQGK